MRKKDEKKFDYRNLSHTQRGSPLRQQMGAASHTRAARERGGTIQRIESVDSGYFDQSIIGYAARVGGRQFGEADSVSRSADTGGIRIDRHRQVARTHHHFADGMGAEKHEIDYETSGNGGGKRIACQVPTDAARASNQLVNLLFFDFFLQ